MSDKKHLASDIASLAKDREQCKAEWKASRDDYEEAKKIVKNQLGPGEKEGKDFITVNDSDTTVFNYNCIFCKKECQPICRVDGNTRFEFQPCFFLSCGHHAVHDKCADKYRILKGCKICYDLYAVVRKKRLIMTGRAKLYNAAKRKHVNAINDPFNALIRTSTQYPGISPLPEGSTSPILDR